ncbi:MAG: tRNA (N6-threonylcarbamoyladenosine(37)-N6)-methyltransferase TrmO [Pontiellaceae bacterium]|nr:tRNA (N6-threonylcarbamoyladenosine(37)-N6)-methyltransferase TrmO [Pontiellaceae bacterium]MBN2786657.1 tRNA (N6-threonylcarbamoyladenosine(37)-N6)-methyltransferase TrmO [Pontiellaceae bacterium]
METNTEKNVTLTLIGTIHTPHSTLDNIPVQPVGGAAIEGYAELFPEYAEGLTDLDGFSHAMLIFHLHRMKPGFDLMPIPFMDDKPHGVFATRSPRRPAAIGVSTVRVKRVENGRLYFSGADMLDGSPLIDIKPFFKHVDNQPDAVSGWLEEKEDNIVKTHRSDARFA